MSDNQAAATAAALVMGDMLSDTTPAPTFDQAKIDRALADGRAIEEMARAHLRPKRGGGVVRHASWTQETPQPSPSSGESATSTANRFRAQIDALPPEAFAELEQAMDNRVAAGFTSSLEEE